jgi:hypothetical protein
VDFYRLWYSRNARGKKQLWDQARQKKNCCLSPPLSVSSNKLNKEFLQLLIQKVTFNWQEVKIFVLKCQKYAFEYCGPVVILYRFGSSISKKFWIQSLRTQWHVFKKILQFLFDFCITLNWLRIRKLNELGFFSDPDRQPWFRNIASNTGISLTQQSWHRDSNCNVWVVILLKLPM